MAVDFDFDGSFNEEDSDEEGFDLDDEEFDEEDEGEDTPRRRNTFRLILYVLLILVLLCVVCFLGSRFVSLSSILPESITSAVPGLDSPQPAQPVTPQEATDEPVSPATEEPAAPETTDEAPVVEATEETQPPAATTEPTDESQVPIEATDEAPTVVVQPTDEPQPTDESAVTPTEALATPTTSATVVPGPTATPTLEVSPTVDSGPTVVVGTCDDNTLPVAQATVDPNPVMRGKGQAVVTLDGSGSTDADGEIVSYEWDFGDNTPQESGETVTHGYVSVGSYLVTLTVTDNCGGIDQTEVEVVVTGPTPPAGTGTATAETPTPTTTATATATVTVTVTATSTPDSSAQGTVGFCHRVQRGDTLSGLARRYGVPWPDLAYVNNVRMDYYVIAGQGLFIPTGSIIDGPNLYRVQDGDTLNSVAFQCGLLTTHLAQVNGLAADASLSPDQMLMIPPWNYIKYY